MMCLANVYFFLDGTARRWYVNNEDITGPEAFKNGLSGLFGDRQRYTRRAEEQLKCRAQRSGEEVHSPYIQSVLGLPGRVNPLMRRRKSVTPNERIPPEPRKTDVWRTADNRPVCFHCGRPGHVMRLCRERKAVFDNSRNRRRNFDDVGTEEEIRRPNSSRRFTPSPTRGRSPIRRYRSRRHIADPVSRQAVGARKLNRATFQGGEAACTGNPPSTAKMTGNQLDVIIDKKPIRALVDSGASFSVISDKYRRFLKKVLFADAKSVMLKVADGNFVRPIGNVFYVSV
ncbi:CCHC-type domain-containing protein [Trichonephila clavipes]|nr:CCHC-type domain-containing protein [Trichonephila clavipes]